MTKRNTVKSIILFILISLFALSVLAFAGCSDDSEKGDHVHSWGEYVTVKQATCTEDGVKERACSVCGEKETAVIDKTGHNFGEWTEEVPETCTEDGVKAHKDCLNCGKHFDADGNEIEDITIYKRHILGDWIPKVPPTYEENGVKGHYACSRCGKNFDENFEEITDLVIDKLVDDFDRKDGDFPQVIIKDGKSYVKLGYYPQTAVTDAETVAKLDSAIQDGLVPNSLGYYKLDGNCYAKKTATPYVNGDSYDKFTDGTKIVNGKDYYFVVEPVLWRVLKTESGNYTLISEMAIDVSMFDPLQFAEEENDKTHNPNDYSLSYIRSILNGDFYEKTFRTFEKKFIVLSAVDNGAYDATEDRIFLPSESDMNNAAYGFETDADRMVLATDYLRASGTYMVPMVPEGTQVGYAKYWLRTAGEINVQNAVIITCYGTYSENETRQYTCSVRPMLVIKAAE